MTSYILDEISTFSTLTDFVLLPDYCSVFFTCNLKGKSHWTSRLNHPCRCFFCTFWLTNWHAIKAMPTQFIQFYLDMILIKLQFLININSISIISWVLLSISITISITKTGPYQYQYIINFSNFSLSISIPISISQFFPINISLSMHCATLHCTEGIIYLCVNFFISQRRHSFLYPASCIMDYVITKRSSYFTHR